jgi:hypothetical protein
MNEHLLWAIAHRLCSPSLAPAPSPHMTLADVDWPLVFPQVTLDRASLPPCPHDMPSPSVTVAGDGVGSGSSVAMTSACALCPKGVQCPLPPLNTTSRAWLASQPDSQELRE